MGKADVGKRIIAVIIDAILVAIITMIVHFVFIWLPFNLESLVSGIVSAGLFGIRDALPIADLRGASPGKRLMGLRAERKDGGLCDYETSIKRNAPFIVPSLVNAFLSLIPVVGLILSVLVGLAGFILVIVELYKVVTDGGGVRLGDILADTHVIDTKTGAGDSFDTVPQPPPAAGPVPPPPPPPPPTPSA